jgi:hypothetical protein
MDYDSAQVKLTIACDFGLILGFEFRWSYGDPTPQKFLRMSKVFASMLIGYMLCVFAFRARCDHTFFTEGFCVLIGIAGVFGCNPVTLFVPAVASARLSDHVFLTVFAAVFRMFCQLQLAAIRTGHEFPGLLPVVFAGMFFTVYGILDVSAAYGRSVFVYEAEMPLEMVLPSEILRMILQGCYIVLCGLSLGLTYQKGISKKLVFFTVVVLLDLISIVFSQITCLQTAIFAFTIVPDMVYTTVLSTSAAFVIFFMHPHEDNRYNNMPSYPGIGGGLLAQISSSSEEDENEEDALK